MSPNMVVNAARADPLQPDSLSTCLIVFETCQKIDIKLLRYFLWYRGYSINIQM